MVVAVGGWSVRGWRLVVGWWLLLAWVVVVFFSAAGRYGVLRGGVARWRERAVVWYDLSAWWVVVSFASHDRRLAAVDTARVATRGARTRALALTMVAVPRE